MSDNEQRQRQTTTTSLPSNQQRNVDTLLNDALRYYNTGGREFYTGDPIADFTPAQISGQQQNLDFAGGVGQQLATDAISANNFFLNPENIFNPDAIPGFTGAVDDLSRTYTRNLTENILPYVRGEGTLTGQFGGSAQGVGQALAVDRTTENLGDSLSNLYLGAYGQGLDSFNQAIGRSPGLYAFGLAPGQTEQAIGGIQQNQNQRETQADIARFEFNQNEPIAMLQLLQSLTGQAGQYGGTVRSDSVTEAASSPITQALGGALSLASLWNPALSLFGSGPAASAPISPTARNTGPI